MTETREIASLVQQLGVEDQRTGGVLLVDDEPLNLTVLSSFLEDAWTVHQATSGEEALRVAEAVPLDVVVTDQRMPGMTGVDLLEELRHRRPDVAGIVLTGYADLQALESAINRAHAFRFLRKPWERADILQAIEQASAQVIQRRTIDRLLSLLARRGDALEAALEEQRRQQHVLLDLDRLSTVGRISAGVTHDLRNVMVALRAVQDELAQGAVAEELREVVTAGAAGVDALLRTLETIHEYARGGGLSLQLAPVPAKVVLADAVAIARMDPRFRFRRVECELAPDLPPMRADRQKLTQVLVNLLRNALQATADGRSVWVAARRADAGVELSVDDEGPGVPAELRARLFQPFASSKGEGGLGLGLYMAGLIVSSHGGAIALAEGKRGGARFEVRVPAFALPG